MKKLLTYIYNETLYNDKELFDELSSFNCECKVFSDLKECSKKTFDDNPDISLFNCDAFDLSVFREFYMPGKDSGVIVLCNYISEIDFNTISELMAVYVVIKPVTANQLIYNIRNIISTINKLNEWKAESLKYNLLFGLGSEAIVVVEQDSLEIIDANDLALRYYGTLRGELLGKKITDFSAEPEVTLNAVKSATKDYNISVRYQKRKDGTPFPTEARVKVLNLNEKRYLYVAFRDITEKISFEEKMIYAKECFLEFGTNIDKNINILTVLAGKLLKCKSGIYLRKNDDVEKIIGKFNLSEKFNIFNLSYSNIVKEAFNNANNEVFWQKYDKGSSAGYFAIIIKNGISQKYGILFYETEPHQVLTFEDINVLKIIAGIIEIEELRRTSEEGYLNSENKFKSYVEAAPYGIFISDRYGNYVDVNDAACKYLGYSKNELIHMKVKDILPDSFSEEGMALYQSMLISNRISAQVQLLRKNNTVMHASLDTAKIDDKRYIAFVKDIEETIKIEGELFESKKYASQMFNLIPEAVFIQCDSKIVAINTAGIELYGGKKEEDFIGLSIYSLFHKSFYYIIEDRINWMKQNGKAIEPIEEIHLTLNGDEIFVEVTAAPVIYEGKKSVIVVARNVKERKSAEEVKKRYISELKLLSDYATALNLGNDVEKIRDSLIEKLKTLYNNSDIIALNFTGTLSGYYVKRVFCAHKESCTTREFLSSKTYSGTKTDIFNNKFFSGKLFTVSTEDYNTNNEFVQIIKDIYSIGGYKNLSVLGYTYENNLGGDIVFIADKQETQLNVSIIETLANQVAVAINRKMFEDKLQHTLKEKEALIKEIHHRVKNNLQIIASLLNLQIDYVDTDETKILLTESLNRIRSMALIHERLYQSKNLAKINFAEYVVDLCNYLLRAYKIGELEVNYHFNIESKFLTMDSIIPIGLIINELVSNSLKYAFVGRNEGNITIRFHQHEKNNYRLMIADDGVGLPKGFNINESKTMGTLLVNNLVDQIDGKIEIINKSGLKNTIIFKLDE